MYIMSKCFFTLHEKLDIIVLWDSPESNASSMTLREMRLPHKLYLTRLSSWVYPSSVSPNTGRRKSPISQHAYGYPFPIITQEERNYVFWQLVNIKADHQSYIFPLYIQQTSSDWLFRIKGGKLFTFCGPNIVICCTCAVPLWSC